jgi:hypothetical protein
MSDPPPPSNLKAGIEKEDEVNVVVKDEQGDSPLPSILEDADMKKGKKRKPSSQLADGKKRSKRTKEYIDESDVDSENEHSPASVELKVSSSGRQIKQRPKEKPVPKSVFRERCGTAPKKKVSKKVISTESQSDNEEPRSETKGKSSKKASKKEQKAYSEKLFDEVYTKQQRGIRERNEFVNMRRREIHSKYSVHNNIPRYPIIDARNLAMFQKELPSLLKIELSKLSTPSHAQSSTLSVDQSSTISVDQSSNSAVTQSVVSMEVISAEEAMDEKIDTVTHIFPTPQAPAAMSSTKDISKRPRKKSKNNLDARDPRVLVIDSKIVVYKNEQPELTGFLKAFDSKSNMHTVVWEYEDGSEKEEEVNLFEFPHFFEYIRVVWAKMKSYPYWPGEEFREFREGKQLYTSSTKVLFFMGNQQDHQRGTVQRDALLPFCPSSIDHHSFLKKCPEREKSKLKSALVDAEEMYERYQRAVFGHSTQSQELTLAEEKSRQVLRSPWLENNQIEQVNKIGCSVEVFWPEDNKWYPGLCKAYNCDSGRHFIQYPQDKYFEWLDLRTSHIRNIVPQKKSRESDTLPIVSNSACWECGGVIRGKEEINESTGCVRCDKRCHKSCFHVSLARMRKAEQADIDRAVQDRKAKLEHESEGAESDVDEKRPSQKKRPNKLKGNLLNHMKQMAQCTRERCPECWWCDVCCQHENVHTLLTCDVCHTRVHMECFDPPILQKPYLLDGWICPTCSKCRSCGANETVIMV